MSCFNFAVRSFSIAEVLKFIAEVLRAHAHPQKPIPLVSVGSGKAYLESKLLDAVPVRLELICVDPKPDGWEEVEGKVAVQPQYATVKELVAARPQLVSGCIVLLNWPNPNDHAGSGGGWDLEAIHLLHPWSVIMLVEFQFDRFGWAGAAGSKKLHAWMVEQKQYDMRSRWTLAERKRNHINEFCPSLLWFYSKYLYPALPNTLEAQRQVADHEQEINDQRIKYSLFSQSMSDMLFATKLMEKKETTAKK